MLLLAILFGISGVRVCVCACVCVFKSTAHYPSKEGAKNCKWMVKLELEDSRVTTCCLVTPGWVTEQAWRLWRPLTLTPDLRPWMKGGGHLTPSAAKVILKEFLPFEHHSGFMTWPELSLLKGLQRHQAGSEWHSMLLAVARGSGWWEIRVGGWLHLGLNLPPRHTQMGPRLTDQKMIFLKLETP